MATNQLKVAGSSSFARQLQILYVVLLLTGNCFALDPQQSLGQFRLVGWNDGLWLPQQNAAVASLVVRPHFYQTPWFYALCAGAMVATVWLLWRWRLQQILDERTRLSRELHDTAARGMVALIWHIEGAKSILKKGRYDKLLGSLDEASKLARESLRETRRAVRALRSEIFDSDCSLASALQTVLDEAARRAHLKTEFKVSGAPYPTSRRWEQALLRITQESVTNTLKYAQAKRFQVELCYSPAEIGLQLHDDGIGFDNPPGCKKTESQDSWITGGLGILGIKERVRQLGGRIQIESSANHGTTIRITIPRQRQMWRWLLAFVARPCHEMPFG
jgi:signal transduction histidine kinase